MSQSSNKTETRWNVPYFKPLGKSHTPSEEGKMLALLALSHTVVEHRLYLAMKSELNAQKETFGSFGIRRLMRLTGLSSYSSIRRGCLGLVGKLSVETVSNGDPNLKSLYRVYPPPEVFARRRAAVIDPYPKGIQEYASNSIFGLVVEGVVERRELSRREALVSLCCAEGLSNAQIGKKLEISEKTVKYHLRSIFIKLGVKRRSELVGRLLQNNNEKKDGTNGNFM